jgi:hypothetical protein
MAEKNFKNLLKIAAPQQAAKLYSKENFKGNQGKIPSPDRWIQKGYNCGSGELAFKHSPTDKANENPLQVNT